MTKQTANPTPGTLPAARLAINVQGVITLRWVAVVGQLFTILGVHLFLAVPLPLVPLLTVLSVTAALNIVLQRYARSRRTEADTKYEQKWNLLLWATMLFDLLALSTQLYFSGGLTNPFSMFFFVNLVLAAMVLPGRWVWSLLIVSIFCVGLLLIWYEPLALPDKVAWDNITRLQAGRTLKIGALIAYSTCATVIVAFTNRISDLLRKVETRNRRLTERRTRNQHLESLGTLAAGAAHELSTPLSSIAIIVKEVENSLTEYDLPEETFEDIRTIRSQLDRCRGILDRMSTDAGDATGDPIVEITAQNLFQQVIESELLNVSGSPNGRVRLQFEDDVADCVLRLPVKGIVQALRALLQNAIDASMENQSIDLVACAGEQSIQLTIHDSGIGMDAETLRRVGEPFFTTKEAGRGTGLGIFLARNVLERLGGSLTFRSRWQKGTSAIIQIPLQVSAAGDDLLEAGSDRFSLLTAMPLDLRLRRRNDSGHNDSTQDT